jgi:uncharacterized protein YwqG
LESPPPTAEKVVARARALGGRPDLPRGARWPRCGGHPLSILMQVDLAELAAAVPGATSARGTLSVFADLRVRRRNHH